jgi:2EXR family
MSSPLRSSHEGPPLSPNIMQSEITTLIRKASQPTETTCTEFRMFTMLPMELQDEIWRIAAGFQPEDSPRIQRIAPDSISLKVDVPTNARLHILDDEYGFPALLWVCRASRTAALKRYTLWPGISKHVYVNKEHDIFYFEGHTAHKFWFLDAVSKHGKGTSTDDDELARLRYMELIKGIKHFAFDSRIHYVMHHSIVLWLQTWADVEDMSIVFQDHSFPLYATRKFVSTTPRSLANRYALDHWEGIEIRFKGAQKDLPAFHLPSINPVTSVPKGDGA